MVTKVNRDLSILPVAVSLRHLQPIHKATFGSLGVLVSMKIGNKAF